MPDARRPLQPLPPLSTLTLMTATARRLYDAVAENRGFIQYVIQL